MHIALLLATVVACVTAKNSYVVVAPTSFRPGIPLSIGVNILNSSAPVIVTASLAVNLNSSAPPVIVIASLAVNQSVDTVVIQQIPGAVASGEFHQGVPGTLELPVPENMPSGGRYLYRPYLIQIKGTGHGLNFQNQSRIDYRSKGLAIFIQTDKAMYKPGQTVNFRAFATFPNLTVYTGPLNVDITDPRNNKVKQWRGLQETSGVITNKMLMDTEPILGNWKIQVSTHKQTETKYFEVKHYVLPKFDVKVELPPYILTSDNKLSGTVKAKYTYGKPVTGTVSLRARFSYFYGPYDYQGDVPMVTENFNINGEAHFDVPLDHILKIQPSLSSKSIVIEANVTENINQITLGGQSSVMFHDSDIDISFLSTNPSTFKQGLPYTAYLKVQQQDGTPLMGPRDDVNVSARVTYQLPKLASTPYPWYYPARNYMDLPNKIYSVPESGLVAVELTMPLNATSISLTAHYGKASASKSISRSYSPSDNYMQIFLRSENITAGQVAHFDIDSTESISNAIYQVMSRGSVVSTGEISGSTFSILTTDKMAPRARVIVYYVRADGEIVTDTIGFDVAGVFLNKVSINFDKTKAEPHENVNVMLTADPSSVVNLLAVDQSVQLLKSGNDITTSKVVQELESFDTVNNYYYPYSVMYYGGSDAGQSFSAVSITDQAGFGYYPFRNPEDRFPCIRPICDKKNAGVQVLTDATVYSKRRYYNGPEFFGSSAGGFLGGGGFNRPQMGMIMSTPATPFASKRPTGRVRSIFPETWLWSDTVVGADGRATVNTTVPDTITSWVASAFAVNSQTGLGVSPTSAKIQGFRPFFVSLNLPYSVIRGEQLALQANVFNYMAQDMDVLVTLEKSDDYRNIIVDVNGNTQFVSQVQTETIHVAAGDAKSVFFPIVPAALGKIPITVKAQSTMAADAVRRQLLVEPEGVPKEYSNYVLVDLKNASTFSNTVSLSLPAGVVSGSQRAVFTAIGDVLGPSVNGLDKLLRMPVGCGEQVMTSFAPDIFVTNYLNATNQLTSEIQERAFIFMEKGYQRELSYQHYDGSFSAFGSHDGNGSMWLTAFVVKSFHQARNQIYIDDYTLERAIRWMIKYQTYNGQFLEPGHVHNRYLQGGAQHGTALTAFVLISLLENWNHMITAFPSQMGNSVARAKRYLEDQVDLMTDDYALAITSYALKLANSAKYATAFDRLNNHATVKDGVQHWQKNRTSQPSHYYWRPPYQQADPIEIETSAYALLVHAANKNYSAGMPVLKWLTRQRNAIGGFASTQDTVIGLQALTEFATLIYSKDTDMQITVTGGNFTQVCDVNQQNSLVLQSIPMPDFPSQISISATGRGFALADISLSFHVEQEIEPPTFDIQLTMINETKDLLSIQSCARWLEPGASGMAVQEFGIPSGFEADLESISGHTEIKRTETEDRKVILYFDEISSKPLCLTLDMIRTGLVAKSQPAAIKLFDYYQPRNQVTKFYQSHILQNTEICDVCPECGGCPITK